MQDRFVEGVEFLGIDALLESPPLSLADLRGFFTETSGVFAQYLPLDLEPPPHPRFDWSSFTPSQWEALRAAWRRKCTATVLDSREINRIIHRVA
jgi:hypothetical protein